MKVEYTTELTIKEICAGFIYLASEHKGLYGMNGKLKIQPEYQRNYIYGDGKKDVALIQSIINKYPIGTVYFYKVGEDKYELLDGQQRITSIGRFLHNAFAVNIDGHLHYYNSLSKELRDSINDYKMCVCYCSGDDFEIFDWFKTTNVPGVPLNDQEVFNAVYHGPFVNLMRAKYANVDNNYTKVVLPFFMSGSIKRQDYIKQAIEWTTTTSIPEYMSTHRHDEDIDEVVNKVESICDWITATFKCTHPLMKGLQWGRLYDIYHNNPYDSNAVHNRMNELIADPTVRNKRNIFEFILNGEHNAGLLNIRLFDENTKLEAYTRQTTEAEANNQSNCPMCTCTTDENRNHHIYELSEMEADHITAWRNGGSTTADNCQMLCKAHNRMKGAL